MKSSIKLLTLTILVILMSAFFVISGSAVERSGNMLSDGSLTYTFKDGVLTINGKQDGLKFDTSLSWDCVGSVWHNGGWNEEITEVVVNAEVGYIGKYVLASLPNCTKITLPASVTSIGLGGFAGNTKLLDIRVSGVDYSDIAEEHFYDLRNTTWIAEYTFDAAAQDNPAPVLLFGIKSGLNFGKFFQKCWTQTITCYVYPASNAEAQIISASKKTIDNDPEYEICDKIAVKYYESSIAATPLSGEVITSSASSWPMGVSWNLDLESGTLYLNTTGSLTFKEYAHTDAFTTWKNTWKNAVKRIEVGPYSKICVWSLIAGYPNCDEMLFQTSVTIDASGLNSPCLKTVGFLSNYEEEVIDLSVIRLQNASWSTAQNLLENCSAITNVKFPATNIIGAYLKVSTSMFKGCTSLESITIPSYITEISASAFSGCTALRSVYIENTDVTIASDAFSGCSDVILYVDTFINAEKVNAKLKNAGIDASVAFAMGESGGMTFEGYQVRIDGYNGLRTIFSYDESVISSENGFNFVEYGTIVATAANFNSFAATIGEENSILLIDDGEIVSSNPKIIKTKIRDSKGYHNNYYENKNGTIAFNTVIVRYKNEDQMKTDVIIAGYDVWEKDGVYYAFFTKGSYGKSGDISLYKATLGMLSEGIIELGRCEDSPVWNTLESCESTSYEATAEGIKVMTFADPANSGKNVAVILNESGENIVLESLSFIDANVKNSISRYIFEESIILEVPGIDSYWQEHINSKLNAIPAGKSFIYVVDTHWEGNQRKSTELIEYVRSLSGIETVIHGGDSFDSYSSSTAVEDSKTIFMDALGTHFYDAFDSQGLFSVGNHDSNFAGWEEAKKRGETEGNESGFWKYALPDSYIYETTTKNLEGKVSFDAELIEKIENGTITFTSNGGYSADEMKAEALAWAKMHYTYDDAENGIRYIVLSTNDCGLTSYYTFGEMYESILKLQFDWLYNVLLDTAKNKSDYDVVIAGHSLGSSNGIAVGSEFYEILRAFKSGSSASFTLTAATDNSAAAIGNPSKSYDFSGTSFGGTVFTINGHAHVERTWIWQNGTISAYSPESTLSKDAILSIMCLPDSTTGGYPYELTGEAGTVTEQSFTIITITSDGRIVCTKIGAGSDRIINYK